MTWSCNQVIPMSYSRGKKTQQILGSGENKTHLCRKRAREAQQSHLPALLGFGIRVVSLGERFAPAAQPRTAAAGTSGGSAAPGLGARFPRARCPFPGAEAELEAGWGGPCSKRP